MEGEVAFERGSDLYSSVLAENSGALVCECCGARIDADSAPDLGWQIRPPVCPDCLRWSAASDAACVADRSSTLRIERRGRFWAVLEDGELVCLTAYRKGARAVVRRLGAVPEGNGHGRR